MSLDETLFVFSPLPPEQNGIADYTFNLLSPLSELFRCKACVSDVHAQAPRDVEVMDYLQAFRFIEPESTILHQIGNNPGHVFVLDALRRWGGVTTLHDQSLHYLYEVARTEIPDLVRLMMATSRPAGTVYGTHLRELGVKTAANYAIFDMLSEVLSLSDSVIVHSEFAKRRIGNVYGSSRGDRVFVVPHVALPFESSQVTDVRSRLEIADSTPLIVTAGFATAAKRFDWLVAALDELCNRHHEFFWVHAGMERREEYDLTALLARHPRVQKRCVITGYLTEDALNAYLRACDILVNLRFPSVGESSGTLARAMTAGKCCIISDTAAYEEIPRNAAVHIPIYRPARHLLESLEGLLGNPDLRKKIEASARKLAEAAWSPRTVANAYREVLRAAKKVHRPIVKHLNAQPERARVEIGLTEATTREDVNEKIGNLVGAIEIVFVITDTRALAALTIRTPKLLKAILPASFAMVSHAISRRATDNVEDIHRGGVLLIVNGMG